MSGFVARVRPDYGWEDKIAKLSPEAFEQWKEQAHSITKIESCATPEEVKKLNLYHDLIMDAEEMVAWTAVGIELRVGKVRGLASNVKRGGDFAQTVYQVHVANVGLMQILQVEVLENECTNELQDWLNRGWRILAVCPPNDARRPSYIIGHTEKGAT